MQILHKRKKKMLYVILGAAAAFGPVRVSLIFGFEFVTASFLLAFPYPPRPADKIIYEYIYTIDVYIVRSILYS